MLDASPETVHWGYFDAKLEPVLRVPSGALVSFGAEPAAVPEIVQQMKPRSTEAFRRIVERSPKGPSSHILTGPVFVEGAEPGDVLEVRFESIRLRYDWGFNAIIPLKGGLAEEFPSLGFTFPSINKKTMTASWNGIGPMPLAPFFAMWAWRHLREWAGCHQAFREPGAGTWTARSWCREHFAAAGVQQGGAIFPGRRTRMSGRREVNSFALETGLDADVRLGLLRYDLARTEDSHDTHIVFMGFDPILDNAAKNALREAVDISPPNAVFRLKTPTPSVAWRETCG